MPIKQGSGASGGCFCPADAAAFPKDARFDLHLHTTASDGTQSPGEVVALAKEMGLYGMAITDHDTLSGLEEANEAAAGLGLMLLPGVEMSAGGDAEVHILGYGVRTDCAPLMRRMEALNAERLDRLGQIVAKCAALHMPLAEDDLHVGTGDSVGRVHVAEAMVARGYCASIREAFDRYLKLGKPCYVARPPVPVNDTIDLLKSNGAVPVLAHPGQLRMGELALSACLPGWCEAGLMGLEVYHPSHMPHLTVKYKRLAERHGLLITGGSDAHGARERAKMGDGLSRWEHAGEDVWQLLDRVASLGPKD